MMRIKNGFLFLMVTTTALLLSSGDSTLGGLSADAKTERLDEDTLIFAVASEIATFLKNVKLTEHERFYDLSTWEVVLSNSIEADNLDFQDYDLYVKKDSSDAQGLNISIGEQLGFKDSFLVIASINGHAEGWKDMDTFGHLCLLLKQQFLEYYSSWEVVEDTFPDSFEFAGNTLFDLEPFSGLLTLRNDFGDMFLFSLTGYDFTISLKTGNSKEARGPDNSILGNELNKNSDESTEYLVNEVQTPSEISQEFTTFIGDTKLRSHEIGFNFSAWDVNTTATGANYLGLLDYVFEKNRTIDIEDYNFSAEYQLGFLDSILEVVFIKVEASSWADVPGLHIICSQLKKDVSNSFLSWEHLEDSFQGDGLNFNEMTIEELSASDGQYYIQNDLRDMLLIRMNGVHLTISSKTAAYVDLIDLYTQEQIRLEEEEAHRLQEEANRREAEAKKALRCPLEPVGGKITKDSAGVPYVYAHFKNVTDKTIDAYEVEIRCYDRFHEPVRHYSYGSNKFKGQSQHTIKPGKKSPSGTYWYMHGYDLLAEATVKVTRVHFTDDTVVIPKGDCETLTVYLVD